MNLPSRNPAHGRAPFSRRASRRSTLRIFCFAGPWVDGESGDGESGDRRNVFSYRLKRLVLLIMIGDFQNGGNFPSVPRFPMLGELPDRTHGCANNWFVGAVAGFIATG